MRVVGLGLQPRREAVDHGVDEGRLLARRRRLGLPGLELRSLELVALRHLVDLALQRRAALQGEIDQVAKSNKLEAPQLQPGEPQPAAPGQEAAFIHSMVDRLAARLKAQPDDPQGWARLIRAYGVLHQDAPRQAAIAEAQRLFKARPNDLKTALSGEATIPPPPTPPG